MHSLQNFNYNGQIIQRRDDGFVNLTQMCQANGKRIDHWKALKATDAYIQELQANYPESRVVYTEEGVNGGTWGHPSIAINLARWISPKFAVWCDAHIFNLMASGQTSLDSDPLAEMKLKIELAKLERDKAALENRTIELRHTIVTTCPEPVQQKILGYQVVEKVEYRDRVLLDDQLIRDGSTLTKKQLCDRYGFKTRNGSPDYRRLNAFLNNANLPSEAWKLSATILENHELNREYLGLLDDRFSNGGDRQMFLGE